MLKNDPIQGIIFDAKPKIEFQNPPAKRINRLLLDVKHQLIKTRKAYIQKRYKPTFSTNLLPKNSKAYSTNPGKGTRLSNKRKSFIE